MDETQFILLLPAGAGVFSLVYFVLMLMLKIITPYLEKKTSQRAYDKAYQNGSTKEVDKADLKLAHQKLKELATTKKSYRTRKTDIKFVIAMGLPPSIKLQNLLTGAISNQNDPETRELITDYLQQVTSALKLGSSATEASITVPDWRVFTSNHTNYYVPAASLFLLVVISLIYLAPWIERMNKKQISWIAAFIVLALTISFTFFTRRQLKRLPASFGLSVLILCALLYLYSNVYHKNRLVPHRDSNFDGIVDCPQWFRSDESCSTPIFITSTSDSPINMRVVYDNTALLLRKEDGGCKEIVGTDFSVSRSTPYSFRLQSKNEELFIENGRSVNVEFVMLSDTSTIIPLDGMKCEIQLENNIWADSRSILFGILGISGGLTFIPFIFSFINNQKKTL